MKTEDAYPVYDAGFAVKKHVRGFAAKKKERLLGPSQLNGDPGFCFYPNSEDIAPDEMRVIACGTGMPTTRAAQAAACFLVELGNGDKFLFDIGTAFLRADLAAEPGRSELRERLLAYARTLVFTVERGLIAPCGNRIVQGSECCADAI